jgi:hypothetical protein
MGYGKGRRTPWRFTAVCEQAGAHLRLLLGCRVDGRRRGVPVRKQRALGVARDGEDEFGRERLREEVRKQAAAGSVNTT